MSAILSKADIAERDRDVRLVPKADQMHPTKMVGYSIISLARHATEGSDADDVTLLIVH